MNTEEQGLAEAGAKTTETGTDETSTVSQGTQLAESDVTDHELARAEGEGMATGTTIHTEQPLAADPSPFDKTSEPQTHEDLGAAHTALIDKVVALADTCGIGMAHNAHDMLDHIHKYVHGVQDWIEKAAAEVQRLRLQLAAGEGQVVEEAETQADGVYDDVVADVRKVFSGRKLVLTVARDHLEDLAVHALPNRYRGRWGSYPDVPRPQASTFEVPAIGEENGHEG